MGVIHPRPDLPHAVWDRTDHPLILKLGVIDVDGVSAVTLADFHSVAVEVAGFLLVGPHGHTGRLRAAAPLAPRARA